MVFVDFSNPYLRAHLAGGYCDGHRRTLDNARARLGEWAASSTLKERKAAAVQGRAPRPLAVVLDIDEVLLCNFHMNSFRAAAGVQGDEPVDFHAGDFFAAPGGGPWPRSERRLNPLLPGAYPLLEETRRLGLEIFLLTGRLESIRDETVENLEFVGLAGTPPGALLPLGALRAPGGALIMCPDAEYPPPGGGGGGGGGGRGPCAPSRRRADAPSKRPTASSSTSATR
jgi:hypothetical protein